MAKIKKTENTKCWRGCGVTKTLKTARVECKCHSQARKGWQFSYKKLNSPFPCDPATPFLSMKMYVHINICAHRSMAVFNNSQRPETSQIFINWGMKK